MKNNYTYLLYPFLSLVIFIFVTSCYKDKEGEWHFLEKIDDPLECVGQVTTIPNKDFCRLNKKKAVYFSQSGAILTTGGCNENKCYESEFGMPLAWDSKNQMEIDIFPNVNDIFIGCEVTRIDEKQAIITGGNTGLFTYSPKVYLYNDEQKSIENLGELTLPRAYHTATFDSTNNELILIGGLYRNSGTAIPDSIEILKLIREENGNIEAFESQNYFTNIKVHGHTTNLLPDGAIIVIGGCTALSRDCGIQNYSNDATKLTIDRQGKIIREMTNGQLRHALLEHQSLFIERQGSSFLMLVGGITPTSVIQFYDIDKQRIVDEIIETKQTRSQCTAVLITPRDNDTGDKVLLVGGDSEATASTYEVYHAKEDKTLLGRENLVHPRTRPIAIATQKEDKEIIIIGGGTMTIDKYSEAE